VTDAPVTPVAVRVKSAVSTPVTASEKVTVKWTLAAAGVHVTRDGANNPVIEDWFNDYNGVALTIGGC